MYELKCLALLICRSTCIRRLFAISEGSPHAWPSWWLEAVMCWYWNLMPNQLSTPSRNMESLLSSLSLRSWLIYCPMLGTESARIFWKSRNAQFVGDSLSCWDFLKQKREDIRPCDDSDQDSEWWWWIVRGTDGWSFSVISPCCYFLCLWYFFLLITTTELLSYSSSYLILMHPKFCC